MHEVNSSTKTIATLALLLILTSTHAALPVSVAGEPLPSLAPVLEQVMPAVVNIYTETRVQVRSPFAADPFFRRFFDMPNIPRERVSRSLGSGVIVDASRGLILTNHHVVNGADDIAVNLNDDRSFSAELVGSDEATDVAVIRIDPGDDPLQALPIQTGVDLRVGDFVVAVGNPFGLGQTVTSGIVSALGRAALNRLEFQNFIQTDASINPGNSGGALINLRGELVGINTAIFTPSGGNVGIGFAIPVDMATLVMEQLVANGKVQRGRIGIETQDLTVELAESFDLGSRKGVLVKRVFANSTAEAAGIKVGDVIVQADDKVVSNSQAFHNIEGLKPLGDSIELQIMRSSRQRTVFVTTAIPDNRHVPGDELHRLLRGLTLDDLSAESSGQIGVLVEDIERDSRNFEIGLRPGDIITGLNRVRVVDMSSMRKIAEKLDQSRPIELQIQRNRRGYRVLLE
ncbi:MAG: Do family serine endopeptidase [Gammaproteobacteria bacterium]|jgi:serine protease DegQ|nr:Do family serine endopeptidase [Gammaproteobacteria bacterium]